MTSEKEIIEKVVKEAKRNARKEGFKWDTDKHLREAIRKALSLQRQEIKKLGNQLDNWKGIAERNEEALDEQRKEWIELSNKELTSLQDNIENKQLATYAKARDIARKSYQKAYYFLMEQLDKREEISKIFKEMGQ